MRILEAIRYFVTHVFEVAKTMLLKLFEVYDVQTKLSKKEIYNLLLIPVILVQAACKLLFTLKTL